MIHYAYLIRRLSMRLPIATALFISGSLLTGCAMFTTWKAIPPPGGCDQCHSVEISTNWRIAYQAAHLTDERGQEYFQTAAGSMPPSTKPLSSLDLQKGEDQPCFDCHKSPSSAHKQRRGRYHHH
jgi:hypothetical protein